MGVYSLQSTCLLLMIQIQKLDRFIGAGQFVLYFFSYSYYVSCNCAYSVLE